MAPLLDKIEEMLLMGPGPSCVPEAIYAAIRRPTIGHLDPHFIAIMDAIKTQLRELIGTANQLTIPISGTGSAGMETCFVNLIEPGNRVLVLSNGVFGVRMQDVAGRLGASVEALEFEWGTPVSVDQVARRLAERKYDIVAVVHAETSTGVRNPIEDIGKLLSGSGTIYLVDAVTSLAGIPIDMDACGIDALYSGTQKCISCPPGLSPVSMSEKALAKLKHRELKVPNWYLDLSMIVGYWAGEKRSYHHTAPINMLYALHAALDLILAEGVSKVFERHGRSHEQLVAGLDKMGLKMLVERPYRLPMLNAVLVPEGVQEAVVRERLRTEFHIEIGAGLGPLAGKIWRVGLMGHTARQTNVDRFLDSLKKVLN
jgi:alanine-glyoxylate transaminase/serine-glyoxylate transaminase/serine-pyruvate transaminase